MHAPQPTSRLIGQPACVLPWHAECRRELKVKFYHTQDTVGTDTMDKAAIKSILSDGTIIQQLKETFKG